MFLAFDINNAWDIIKLHDRNHVTNFWAHLSFSNLQIFQIYIRKSMKYY